MNEQAVGWNDRCRLRAAGNLDLRAALEDCNRVLDLDLRRYAAETYIHASGALETPRHLDALDNRGLVYLRLRNLKDAIQDYDSALHINSKIPAALYGRGLAELRLGKKAQGQNDLTAATKLDSGIALRFASMGLAP